MRAAFKRTMLVVDEGSLASTVQARRHGRQCRRELGRRIFGTKLFDRGVMALRVPATAARGTSGANADCMDASAKNPIADRLSTAAPGHDRGTGAGGNGGARRLAILLESSRDLIGLS